MVHAIVKRNDGSSDGRPWLRSVVRNIQGGLAESGRKVEEDGWFGDGTETNLRDFQELVGVLSTGVADRATWEKIEADVIASLRRRQPEVAIQLPTFRGDLHWVHYQEGHKGRPYWPGGRSGVTLDPGVDLGQVGHDLVDRVYGGLLTEPQRESVRRVLGVKGAEAELAIEADGDLRSIELTSEQAEGVLPFAASGYWKGVRHRFTGSESALPAVQTALLSLAYNRGVGNADLEQLAKPVSRGQWKSVADLVGAMQQDHRLRGISRRRRAEANLIRAELDYLNS